MPNQTTHSVRQRIQKSAENRHYSYSTLALLRNSS